MTDAQIALGGLHALAHSSEGAATAMALGAYDHGNNSGLSSSSGKKLIVTKQGSLAHEVAMSDAGATRQVHVVVKNSAFQIQLGFLDDSIPTSQITVEASLIYDSDNLSEAKEVKMMKMKVNPIFELLRNSAKLRLI